MLKTNSSPKHVKPQQNTKNDFPIFATSSWTHIQNKTSLYLQNKAPSLLQAELVEA
jgi:hypothetical protein